MYKNLIIDGHNLFARSFFKKEKEEEHNITNFLKRLIDYEKKYLEENGKVYILFDNSDSHETNRKQIDPDYKMNRKAFSDGFIKEVSLLQSVLLSFKDNYFLIYKTNYEADDLVFPLLDYKIKDEKSLVITNDFDWFKVLEYENVEVLDGNYIINKDNFFKEYGFYPSKKTITRYKTIRGDKTDNINPGIPNLPKKLLLKLVTDIDKFDLIIDYPERLDYLTDKWKKTIIENKARLLLNYSLVANFPLSEGQFYSSVYECKFIEKKLKIFYNMIKANFDCRIKDKDNLF